MTDKNPDILSRDKKDEDAGDKVELQRVLGLPSCIAMLIGLVIGSGIFVNPTAIGRQLQSVGASLCMWLICGLYSITGNCFIRGSFHLMIRFRTSRSHL